MDHSNKDSDNIDKTLNEVQSTPEEKSLPNKFGGWLLPIAGGLILFPCILLLVYIPLYISLFSDPYWVILTTPGTVSYHPYLKPLVIIEIVYMFVLVSLNIFAIILYFRKKRLLPKILILIITLFIVYPLINMLLSRLFAVIRTGEFSLGKFIISSVIGAVLIVYMFFSRRVKNTFVYSMGSNSL